jgi:hypothetical protein
VFLTKIDEWVAQIHEAAGKELIDWRTIQSATGLIELQAETKDQRAAVDRLKQASTPHLIRLAAIGIQQALLHGKPGADGWPRK